MSIPLVLLQNPLSLQGLLMLCSLPTLKMFMGVVLPKGAGNVHTLFSLVIVHTLYSANPDCYVLHPIRYSGSWQSLMLVFSTSTVMHCATPLIVVNAMFVTYRREQKRGCPRVPYHRCVCLDSCACSLQKHLTSGLLLRAAAHGRFWAFPWISVYVRTMWVGSR